MMKDSKYYRDILRPILFNGNECLVTLQDINDMLTNTVLIEHNSMHVVRKGSYEQVDYAGTTIGEIERLSRALEEGCTVVIKELEQWGGPITEACNALGKQVTAHMYISPSNSEGFGFHTDDTDVVSFMLYGTKFYEVMTHGMKRMCMAGDAITLPMDRPHKVTSGNGWSCHISFGIPDRYYKDSHSFPVKLNVLNNLLPELPKTGLHLNLNPAIIC